MTYQSCPHCHKLKNNYRLINNYRLTSNDNTTIAFSIWATYEQTSIAHLIRPIDLVGSGWATP